MNATDAKGSEELPSPSLSTSCVIRRWFAESKVVADSITIDGVDMEHVPTAVLQAAHRRLNLEICVLETLQKRAKQKLSPIISSLHNEPTVGQTVIQRDEQAKADTVRKMKATEEYDTWRSLMHRRFCLVELQEDLQRELHRRRRAFSYP